MRTKALLAAAVIAAFGALSTMAQNVYSLNVVGYINLPLCEGYNLVANQLDLDGTGTNNTIATVFGSNLPVGTSVSVYYNGSLGWGFYGETYSVFGRSPGPYTTNWNGGGVTPVNPGQGVWVNVPTGAFLGATQNVTTVGQVLQGSLTNSYLNPSVGGYSLLGNIVPISGGLVSVLNYQPNVGDAISLYVAGYPPPGFVGNTYSVSGRPPGPYTTNWNSGTEPVLSVGQGFWLQATLQTPNTWSTNFTVQ